MRITGKKQMPGLVFKEIQYEECFGGQRFVSVLFVAVLTIHFCEKLFHYLYG